MKNFIKKAFAVLLILQLLLTVVIPSVAAASYVTGEKESSMYKGTKYVTATGTGYVNPSPAAVSSAADALGLVSSGDRFKYLGETYTYPDGSSGPWYKVDYNGQTGWISAKYSTLTDSESSAMAGIDVSQFNGTVNWQSVKQSGVEFAMLRLFDHIPDTPNYRVDSQLANNIAGAKANGIHIGGYFFSYARNLNDVVNEANMVVELLKQYPATFDFPIVFDAETGDTQDGFDITGFAGDACKTFQSILEQNGYYVMIYANTNWFNNVIDHTKVSGSALWQAHYMNAYAGYTPTQGLSIANNRPAINNNNNHVFMWQFTDSGSVSGISGKVDLNVSYRDYSEIIPDGGFNGYPKAAPSEPSNPPAPTNPIQTAELENAIKEAEALDKNRYTVDSWQKLETELTNAKEALNSDSQTVVDTSLQALRTALSSLAAPDYTELEKALIAVEGIVETEYTPAQWAIIQSVIETATATLNSRDQREIDSVTQELKAEILNKKEPPASDGDIGSNGNEESDGDDSENVGNNDPESEPPSSEKESPNNEQKPTDERNGDEKAILITVIAVSAVIIAVSLGLCLVIIKRKK